MRSTTVGSGRGWVRVGWGGSGGSLWRDARVLRWFAEFVSDRGLFGLVSGCGGGVGWWLIVLVSEVVCGAGVLLLVAVVGIDVFRVRGVATDVRAALLLGFGALLGVLRVRLARD